MAHTAKHKFTMLWPATALLALAAACAASPVSNPARLARVDEATLERVRDHLRQSLGRQDVALGPQTPEATTISILPPALGAYDTRSTATPEIVDIVEVLGSCFLERRDTKATIPLPGVSCVAATLHAKR